MNFFQKKYKVYYAIENSYLNYEDSKSVNNLEEVVSLLSEIRGDYFIGVYSNYDYARVLIKWNTRKKCYNFEVSHGDYSLFKNVLKQEALELLEKFDDVVKDSDKFGFAEDQARWD